MRSRGLRRGHRSFGGRTSEEARGPGYGTGAGRAREVFGNTERACRRTRGACPGKCPRRAPLRP
ncbi:Hypothetical protein A7982_00274 [Minicystis rosea]|nr:Hypothetical protein A7982_00274 [Minicystis rosea]